MGYGVENLSQVADLLRLMRTRRDRQRVLELGAQELNIDIPPSSVLRFIFLLNPDFAQPEAVTRMLPGAFLAPLFRAAGVDYFCVDLFEAEGVLQVDLNLDDLPVEHRGRFDLVTNFGTTEHIFNQSRAFKAIHDAVRVGGIMIHAVPANGLFNHGLVKYEPKFFLYMAYVNDYEILSWGLAEGSPDYMPMSADIPGSANWVGRDLCKALVIFLLRKRNDQEFVQPSDVDLRYVPANYPQALRNAAAPSTSAIPAPAAANFSRPTRVPITQSPDVANAPWIDFVHIVERIESWCNELELGSEPYVLAACLLKHNLITEIGGADCAASAVRRVILDRLVAKAAGTLVEPPEGIIIVDFGRAFLGTGWGSAGGDVHNRQARNFRSVGPSGSSVFLRLNGGSDYCLKLLFFDAVPGDAIFRLRVPLATGGTIKIVGDEYWYSSRLPRTASAEQYRLVEVNISSGEGDKIILQKLILEPIVES